MDSVAFDSAYSMEDFRQLVGRLPRKSKVVHLAVDQSFRHPDFRSLSSQHRALLGDANLVCFPFQGDPRKGFERMLELAFRWVEKGGNRRIAVFGRRENRSEEHTSELQSLMRISYAVFCLKKKKNKKKLKNKHNNIHEKT